MIFFITIRLLDILTTYLNIQRSGVSVEANPIWRFFIEFGFGYFILCQVFIIFIAGIAYKKIPLARISIKVMSWIGFLAVISNTLILCLK